MRLPLAPLNEADLVIAQEAAQMIATVIQKYCK
jgi:hypothetical protein